MIWTICCIDIILFLRSLLWLSALLFCHFSEYVLLIGIPAHTFTKCNKQCSSMILRKLPMLYMKKWSEISIILKSLLHLGCFRLDIFRETSKFMDVFPSKCEYSSSSIWWPNDLLLVHKTEINIIHQETSTSKAHFYFMYWCSSVPGNETRGLKTLLIYFLYPNSSQKNFKILVNTCNILFLVSLSFKTSSDFPLCAISKNKGLWRSSKYLG